jgi:UDPglucose--hexose-1-phosphate uridylyltransferase
VAIALGSLSACRTRGEGHENLYHVVDVRSGDSVWVAGSRQTRPNLPTSCPFCPGGREAPEPYDVRWFVNRWPAMPDDRCEVILYSSDHDTSFASLGTEAVRRVVDLWVDRTVALGARPDIAAVMPFENRGEAVGATISHPHGQLYAFDTVPPVLRAELRGDTCWVCDDVDASRMVSEHGDWRVSVPEAARYPYELLISPRAHRPDLPSLTSQERDDMAASLGDALSRLDRLFEAPMPYMLWVHQRPTDGAAWPTAHLHVEVVALYRSPGTPRYVAAGEVGSGVWFNPLDPREAAHQLRNL